MIALLIFSHLVFAVIGWNIGYRAGYSNGEQDGLEKSAQIARRARLNEIKWN